MSSRSGVNGYFQQLNALASNDIFKNYATNQEAINKLLARQTEEWGYLDIFMADRNGVAFAKNVDISEREYFQKAMAGNNAVSDPVVSKDTGSMQVFVAVPVKQNDGTIVGVLVAALDGNGLSDMIADITYGQSGRAYMINNSNDVTIAHKDKDLVLSQDKTIEDAKSDPGLAPAGRIGIEYVCR